jgi:DNA repair protein SbcC/Rad50
MLPERADGPVVAALETGHRSGGRGGTPGAMLSAGNLNTAALTLFLPLHLSVSVQLPWLILDDPVQSMDEVHVSQFAALLRTLSKATVVRSLLPCTIVRYSTISRSNSARRSQMINC